MRAYLPFIVVGIATGAIYGLAATGLVLTYKTSGIFNFGHGALATMAAYAFYWIHHNGGVDWKIAFAFVVLVLGPLMGLIMERLARQLSRQRTAWKIVGTTGLILLMEGIGSLIEGVDAKRVPPFLPNANKIFRLGGVNIRYSQVMVTVIALIAVAALYSLFRFTRLGIAMRAVVDDPDLMDLQGTSPIRIRQISWVIGSVLASMSGVLILPQLSLSSIVLTFLVVQTFGAAAVGMFSSIPLTFLGGIIVGIGEAVLTKVEIANKTIGGISKGLPFLMLIIIMLVTPKRRLAPPSAAELRPALEWRGPTKLRIGVGVVVFALLASVPLWGGVHIAPYWIGALTTTMIMLSLGLLVRTAGMVSLCTAAFAAIGAVSFSQLTYGLKLPWLVALVICGLFAVPVGAMIAIPAIRLSGVFLALSTLGFGLLIERLFYRRSWMFTVLSEGRRMPRPSWASTDKKYYLVVLFIVLLCVLAIAAINKGRLGRILAGMGDSPTAVSTLGLSINTTRVIVFCVAAYMAAIAGALHGAMLNVAGQETSFYSSFNSLILIAILALAPFRVPWYALFAGVTQVIPAYIPGKSTPHVLVIIFGFFSIMVAMEGGPKPMPERLRRAIEAKFGKGGGRLRSAKAVVGDADVRRVAPVVVGGGAAGLKIEDVTVRFGGLIAVNEVGLDAPIGRITGLIGPNGAGKTTTFNACSGLNRPSSGRVLLHGKDVSSASAPARARLGLGRTFQLMELCESLSVEDNVALGRESSQAGAKVLSQLAAPPGDMKVRDLATAEAIALCGIQDLVGLQAGALSTGQRRLVELARVLAGPFDVLLLDEPSSGLDAEETRRFGEVLKKVVAERGCGILLVEHDMALVMDVCEYIYVLDFGRKIFEGTPADVAASPVVQAAYLGTEAVGV